MTLVGPVVPDRTSRAGGEKLGRRAARDARTLCFGVEDEPSERRGRCPGDEHIDEWSDVLVGPGNERARGRCADLERDREPAAVSSTRRAG